MRRPMRTTCGDADLHSPWRCAKIAHMEAVQEWSEVGERITEARLAAGLSQGELAAQIKLDRTAVVRIEAGDRRITALELTRLAQALGVTLTHLVSRPPAALVSRRTALEESADEASKARSRLDAKLEEHARSAAWLVDHGFLVPPEPDPILRRTTAGVDPLALAAAAREALGMSSGPLGPLVDVLEEFALYLTVVDEAAEGASLLCDGYGVAVISSRLDPGRRRWTAAHELGHHLLQDEYHSDAGVAAGRDEREQRIDRFAGEFLLPAEDVEAAWAKAGNTKPPRSVMLDLAGTYRLSWSAVVGTASRLGLIDTAEARRQRADRPQLGEFFAAQGHGPVPDLEEGATGVRWRRAALSAWSQGSIAAARAVELMYNAIGEDDLPTRTLEDPSP
jgi:transcriptional regulator with XRE-family HTH domain